MKTFKSIYFSALLATVFAGCSQQEDIVSPEKGEYKLMVGTQLYNQPVSRTTAADGVTFDYSAQTKEYPFTLSLNDASKEMNLSLAEGTSSISYKNPEDEFSVEIVEYNVSVAGEMFNNMPLALNKKFDEHQYSFNFTSPIALAENKLTPVKELGSAKLNLPLKVDATGLMIDFTLYAITPNSITPLVGGNSEEIALAQTEETSGSLFYKTGASGLASYYTVLIPFKEKTGTIAAGTTIATLSAVGQTYKINLPADKSIDLSSGKLYSMSVMENLEANLETVSCTVNDWGVENFTSAVAGKDFEIVEGVYHIYSEAGLEEWRKVAATAATANTSAKLMNDIVLTKNWTPIGKNSQSDSKNADYTGTFDGNNKTIKGLNIETSIGYIGFFSSIGNASVVKNLTLEVSSISSTSNGQVTGGVVGQVNAGALIENCHVILGESSSISSEDGNIKNEYGFYAGGICGKSLGTIRNCSVIGTGSNIHIEAKNNAGGISGYLENAIMEGCFVKGITVKGYGWISGNEQGDAAAIVGELKNNAKVMACYSNDYTIACANRGGGIVGRFNGSNIEVYACYTVNGNINGQIEGVVKLQKAGAIIGETNGNSSNKIVACYSSNMTLQTKDGKKIGGIIGNNTATVTSCYTTAEQAGSGTKVDAIGETEKTAMNEALTAAAINWEYIAPTVTTPFPLVIQPKQ